MNKYIWEKVLELVKQDLPTSVRVEVIRYYLLPRVGTELSIAEMEEEESGIEGVDRPDAEEIEIESNPKLKAEEKEMERLMK
jgi:hypothetical protein